MHGHEVTLDEASDLKRGTGRNAHIVLNPQPSDDPRDPYAISSMCSLTRSDVHCSGVVVV